jgi:hypothetical protein
LLVAGMPANPITLPNAICGKQGKDQVRIVVRVTDLAIARLQLSNGFNILELRESGFQVHGILLFISRIAFGEASIG